MAGERPLATQEYHDDWGFQVLGPYNAGSFPTAGNISLWMTDDRDIVIDKITVRAAVKPSIQTNVTFEYETSGTAQGSGVAFTTTYNLNSLTNATPQDLTITETANIIPANSVINLLCSSAQTSMEDLMIHIRYRSCKR